MRLFRRLRLLQRHLLARPVSAAILQVAVEEEAIQGVADVVVMRDVRARPAAAVERIDPRPDPVDRLAHRAAILQVAAADPWPVPADLQSVLQGKRVTVLL